MRTTTNSKIAGTCLTVSCAALLATGCSFEPLSYMSRNACEFVNCDELFFIEDILPLSTRPTGGVGAEGGMDMGEAEVGGH